MVDDNIDAADVLRTLGHDVRVAFDGPAALSVLETFDAEVAVLDVGLPVMDGYELARRIRQRAGARVPRVVAVTGYGQPEDLARSHEASFDQHLVKPVAVDALTRAIHPAPPDPPPLVH